LGRLALHLGRAGPAQLTLEGGQPPVFRLVFVLRVRNAGDNLFHQVETAKRKSALLFVLPHLYGNLPSVFFFAGTGRASRTFEIGEIAGQTAHDALLFRFGGREWESNPPRTGSRPFPDLKSGRPTGDDA